MNCISTLWRGAHRAQYRSPGFWLGSAGSETLQAQQIWPASRILVVDARSPIGE
jgi:hypothetical protein